MKKGIIFILFIAGLLTIYFYLQIPQEQLRYTSEVKTEEKSFLQEAKESPQTQPVEDTKTTDNQTPVTEPTDNFFVGFVIKAHDGDTFRIEGFDKSIRILHIDTPEVPPTRNDYYGIEARDFLRSQILNKEVKLVCPKKDKYSRPLCEVYPIDADINDIRNSYNYLMVKEGFACPFMTKNEEIISAAKEARNNKIGIFSENSTYTCREEF